MDSAARALALAPPDASWALYAGIGVFGVGLVVALLVLLVPAKARPLGAVDRVATYAALSGQAAAERAKQNDAPLAATTEALEGMLRRNRSLDQRISHRLEGAGSRFKASEWLLVHSGVFVGSGFLGLLVSGGGIVLTVIFLVLGAVGPWVYLGLRRSRRRKKFDAALPETLQLMSGALSAGLSLAQAVDTIVREGQEPVASEFRRVLAETRLGAPLEGALEGLADRFESKDFAWAVMAINIQRQVGGNLAELLDTVADTMREREYIRRQVAALAAEGKLSAIVLGGLPPMFLLYLFMSQRDYVMPLFSDIRGIVMIAGAGLWLGVGIFWMSRLVKVEV